MKGLEVVDEFYYLKQLLSEEAFVFFSFKPRVFFYWQLIECPFTL